jgi:hypothetical protein
VAHQPRRHLAPSSTVTASEHRVGSTTMQLESLGKSQRSSQSLGGGDRCRQETRPSVIPTPTLLCNSATGDGGDTPHTAATARTDVRAIACHSIKAIQHALHLLRREYIRQELHPPTVTMYRPGTRLYRPGHFRTGSSGFVGAVCHNKSFRGFSANMCDNQTKKMRWMERVSVGTSAS